MVTFGYQPNPGNTGIYVLDIDLKIPMTCCVICVGGMQEVCRTPGIKTGYAPASLSKQDTSFSCGNAT